MYTFHVPCQMTYAAGDAEIQNQVRVQHFGNGQGARFRRRRFVLAIPGGDRKEGKTHVG